jgi:peptidoglycan/LPS O-acetylase OafA/YrhL
MARKKGDDGLNRFEQLDSLRGIAALCVLLSHLLLVFPVFEQETFHQPALWIVNVFKYTPVHSIWGGHEAVVFFFVLSGFVLSQVWLNGQKVIYSSFLLKRALRLYIPYAAAILAALLVRRFIGNGGIPELSGWFNLIWAEPVTFSTLLHHFLLITKAHTNALDPPIWSLAEEMRISLIFPLIMLSVLRLNWKLCLAAGLLLSCFSMVRGGYHAVPGTFNYVLMFISGALLAKHRHSLVLLVLNRSRFQKALLLAAALVCYAYAWWPFYGMRELHSAIVDEWINTLGVSVFIIFSMASGAISRMLLWRPLVFLGKISYSIYLYHLIVLTSLCYLYYDKLPILVIFVLTVLLTLLISIVSYYWVEKPSIRLGRALTSGNRLNGWPRSKKTVHSS